MSFQALGLTHQGKVRRNNEDAFWVDEKLGLLIVADGMGGHASGEVASAMAVNLIHQHLLAAPKTLPPLPEGASNLSPRAQWLGRAVSQANAAIFEAASKQGEARGMGTTVVALWTKGRSFAAAHVGDSRLYLYREGRLHRLTRDHNLVSEQVAQGQLTAEEARFSESRHVLTRALGATADVEVEVVDHAARKGDLLLLCTDGLCTPVSDAEIEAVLRAVDRPEVSVQQLVELANLKGGPDNVTVVAGWFDGGNLWQSFKQIIHRVQHVWPH